MPALLTKLALLYGALVIGVALGIAIGCDVRRWWRDRQRIKEFREQQPEKLRLVVGGHR